MKVSGRRLPRSGVMLPGEPNKPLRPYTLTTKLKRLLIVPVSPTSAFITCGAMRQVTILESVHLKLIQKLLGHATIIVS
jgi:hypothetical protein